MTKVFARLQELAQPFVDTPNSVLRRQLGLEQHPDATGGRRTHRMSRGKRAHPDDLLPGPEYYLPILQTLAEHDGLLRSRDVIAEVGQKLDGKLKPLDYEQLMSGAIRWENRTRWAANALKNAGLLVRRSDRKWELSESGWEVARSGKVPDQVREAGRSRDGARRKTVEDPR
jgi:hypothetical protein